MRPALVVVVAALIGGALLWWKMQPSASVPAPAVIVATSTAPTDSVIGKTTQGRDIHAYSWGSGSREIVFVGGMAGGYEWNSVALAYAFLDYLRAHPELVPSDLTVTIIPELNIDGVYKVTGKVGPFTAADVPSDAKLLAAGRPTASGVDLNRNFDCNWKPTSMWQDKVVSAGTKAFSEPESSAIRDYALAHKPVAFIFWHSQAGGVFGASCNGAVAKGENDITQAYARASGYKAEPLFTAYSITGDSESWLASIGIPALTVELRTHKDIDWDQNLAGTEAVINYYANSTSASTATK